MMGGTMKAMILAAGLGTRLRPITEFLPKALVEADGKPLIEHALCHLQTYNVSEVIINIHHLGEAIVNYLSQHPHPGMKISFSDESEQLLDTGGGMKKAAWFLRESDPFIVRNVDVISDLNLTAMKNFHQQQAALASLAVRDRPTNRYLLFDDQFQLCGWENRKTGERKITRRVDHYNALAFSGIQVVGAAVFPLIKETGSFSLIDLWLRLSEKYAVKGYLDSHSAWRDAGKL